MSVPSAKAYAELEAKLTASQAELASSRAALAALDAEFNLNEVELEESRAYQSAIVDILRVISDSSTDVRPVFDAIVEWAMALCSARVGSVTRVEGAFLHLMALKGLSLEGATAFRAAFPQKTTSETLHARAVLACEPVQILDLEEESGYLMTRIFYGDDDIGGALCVPLLREGLCIGTIAIARREKGAFPDRLVSLLQTFAAQAVIAIENARLFKETREALEQQTATAEVLQVISNSPTSTQPVFEAIAERALVVSGYDFCVLTRYDGESMAYGASAGLTDADAEELHLKFVRTPSRATALGRAILTGTSQNIADFTLDSEYKPAFSSLFHRYRSGVAVPLVQTGRIIGALAVGRTQVGKAADNLVTLLQTFADQAVIAIDNVGLFKATQEALERQTATAEVLRVIGSSVADAQPVFEKILDSCQALFGVENVGIQLVHDDGHLYSVAVRGVVAEATATFLPRPVAETTTAVAIRERRAMHTPDVGKILELNESYTPFLRSMHDLIGNYSGLIAPLLREKRGIGSILLARSPPKPFTDKEIALLMTFADQAVIAVENARLFKETQEALERQTATAEVLQVISSSVADAEPAFEKILESVEHLIEGDIHALFRNVDGQTHLWAQRDKSGARRLSAYYPVPADRNTHALIGAEKPVIHIPDSSALESAPPYVQRMTRELGPGSAISAPLRWKGAWIGALSVLRIPPRPFNEKESALLRTFADQAVIAIQNSQMFRDTQEALEQQTATSEVLKVISSSISDAQPVFEKILDSCGVLFDVDEMIVVLAGDDGQLHTGAVRGPMMETAAKANPQPLDQTQAGRVIIEKRTFHIPDSGTMRDELAPSFRLIHDRIGNFSNIVAPLLRDGSGIGAIGLMRFPPKPFTDNEIALLTTFADQAVIAIENARLFRETQEALQLQTASAEVLQVISGSPTSTLPVFEAIAERTVAVSGYDFCVLNSYDGAFMRIEAAVGGTDEELAALRSVLLKVRPSRGTVAGRAILSGEPVNVTDHRHDP